MKKLLLAITAIICINGQAQASWAAAARMGVGSFFGSVPLIGAIVYQGNKLASIGCDTNQSILAATNSGNSMIQEIGKATAELNKFTPIMAMPVLQNKSAMGWTGWAMSSSKDFMSHVISTVLTTIAIQLMMNAAMNAATSMIQEDNPEAKPTPAQAKPIVLPVKK
ncbi:MAG: hypothetical protein NTZ68_02430 [Candidatus Dependentiae bacterium]|nr:hypothetical protein [Candidatus Dependentiae bacterium]